MPVQTDALPQALGLIPSGVFIITVGPPGEPDAVGTLVSFVQQLAFDPLTLGIAIRKGRTLASVLVPGRRFVLNICHAGDKHLLRHFAKASRTGPEAFADLRVRPTDAAHGTILRDACAYLECEVTRIIDLAADHDLYLAVPLAGDLLTHPATKPMVHIRRDGTKY